MPKVPTYGDQQISTNPLPGPRLGAAASPEALGAPLAQGAHNAAESAFRIQDAEARVQAEERAKADQVALLDADRKLAEWEVRALHDKNNGALNRRGANAFDVDRAALADYDKTADDIETTLASDRQKAAFRRARLNRRAQVDLTLQRHIAGERQAFDAETTNGYVANAREAALANAGDPQRVGLEIARQKAAIADHAKRTGKPPEWVQQQTESAVSATHGGIIDQMLARGQDQSASAYYAANKDAIAGSDRGRIERLLDEGSTRGQSQRIADDLLVAKGETGQPLTLAEGMALVAERTKDDPKLRAAAEERWAHVFGRQQESRRIAQSTDYERGFKLLTDPKNEMGLLGVPVQLLDSMGPENAARLRSLATKKERPKESAPLAILTLDHMSVREPARFASPATLIGFYDKLSPGDWERYSALQRETLAKGEASETGAATKTRMDEVEAAMGRIFEKPDPKKWSQAEKDTAARVEIMVERAMRANRTMTLKHMDRDGIKKLVDAALIEHTQTKDGWLWDSEETVRAYDTPGADKVALTINQVDAAYRESAAKMLADANMAATDDAIMAMWNADVRKAASAKP